MCVRVVDYKFTTVDVHVMHWTSHPWITRTGIRPQDDNPDAALYPAMAAHIEKKVAETGKKVLIKGCSGGSINSYAFIMSRSFAWRQKHIKAWVVCGPVLGGTITSISSVLMGWQVSVVTSCVLHVCVVRCNAMHEAVSVEVIIPCVSGSFVAL